MLYSFFNIVYSLFTWIHVTCAALVTFIFLPINLFNVKGSPFHKKIGRISVALIFGLVTASFLMLINPAFPNRFALIANEHHWDSFFKATFYEPAFFLWLDLLAVYMVISAIRIWKRIAAIKSGQKAYHFSDVALAVLTASFSIFFLLVGILDLIYYHPLGIFHHNPFGLTLINTAIYTLIIVAFDFLTFFKIPTFLLKWGWALHGYKMLFVWHGLLTAFLVRTSISLNTINVFGPLLEVFFWITTLIIFSFYMKKQHIHLFSNH